MSRMDATALFSVVMTGVMLLPVGNVVEAVGHNVPGTAGKVIKVAGQAIQFAGTFMMLAPLAATSGARILLTVLVLPIATAITKAIAGDESVAGKVAGTIETIIRIAVKIVNIALVCIIAVQITPLAIPLLGLQIYNLFSEDCVYRAGHALLRKTAAFINA